MRILVSALLALSVLASVAAPASAFRCEVVLRAAGARVGRLNPAYRGPRPIAGLIPVRRADAIGVIGMASIPGKHRRVYWLVSRISEVIMADL